MPIAILRKHNTYRRMDAGLIFSLNVPVAVSVDLAEALEETGAFDIIPDADESVVEGDPTAEAPAPRRGRVTVSKPPVPAVPATQVDEGVKV